MGLHRRCFLASSCLSLCAIAGCSAFGQDDPPSVTIPELWIENEDDAEHHLEILLLHGDEPVFVESLDVEAAKYEGDNMKAPGGRAWENVAPEQRPHTLHARIDRERWFTTRFEEFGSGCVRVQIEINREGEGLFVYFACYEETNTTTG